MSEEENTVELNFNVELDSVKGNGSDEVFQKSIIQMLKQSSTAQSLTEGEALGDIRGKIARKGKIEANKEDIELLEKNFNRALDDDNLRIPNDFVGKLGEIINEGRKQLEE